MDHLQYVEERWASLCAGGARLTSVVVDLERGGVAIVAGGSTEYAHIPAEWLRSRDDSEASSARIDGTLRRACQDLTGAP